MKYSDLLGKKINPWFNNNKLIRKILFENEFNEKRNF